MKSLVYTRRADGGVSVCHPMPEILRWMTGGGGYWDDRPRGFLHELVRRKTCPELQRGNVVTEDAAWRFVNAMQFGGCTTGEAWHAIAEHDCARFGTLIEIQDTDDLPDRWFRDAWKRSANGGPVSVDLEKARPIQLAHIARATERQNRLINRLSLWGLRKRVMPQWHTLALAVNHARDEHELRKVWPEGIAT